MKVAVISDLHSNREALDAVFEHIDSQGLETVYCLGDVVGYGPEPEYCVDLVRRRCAFCLLGNHDEAVFRDASDFNPHARGAIEYTRARMQPQWYSSPEKKARWRWLKSLPLSQSEGRFVFVHGSPRDPVREYVLSTDGFLNPDKLRSVFASFESVAVAGHTHHPGLHEESLRFTGLAGEGSLTLPLEAKRKYFVNVGSVGQPRDSDHRAAYAVMALAASGQEASVTWHRVGYDFQATQRKILGTGSLSEVLARRLALGK